MTSQAALLLCILFIGWLFLRDHTLRPMTSPALWIPFCWVVIIGSRPVSTWFLVEAEADAERVMPVEYLEGSPFDRNVFLILIIAALIVLWRRRVDWGRIVSENRCLFAFFLYCGVSVIWSDFAFVSFKRWIKDLGNIVMILVIVTDEAPREALKAIFARYIYLAISLSVLLVKYFPVLSRSFHPYTYEPFYHGVTQNKNQLGVILFISGLFLVWDLVERWAGAEPESDNIDVIVRIVLLFMVLWLMRLSRCSTALVCLTVGTALICSLHFPAARRQVRHLGAYTLAVGLIILSISTFPAVIEGMVKLVGRDMTLTGRTDIWAGLLKEPNNFLLGAGYKSYWLVPARIEKFVVTQAHNGYLETYLNGGLAGLGLLIAMFISMGSKLKREFFDDDFGTFRLSFFVIALLYNWTEALFNALSPLWFLLLICALYDPAPASATHREPTEGVEPSLDRSLA